MILKYYLKIVPTEIVNGNKRQDTYQYSVTEQARAINHQSGSHGVPGIYFKYDMSFVKVKVAVETHSLWRFLVRLCGIIGGVFATSGIVNGLVKVMLDFATNKRKVKLSSVPSTTLPTVYMVSKENLLKPNIALYT